MTLFIFYLTTMLNLTLKTPLWLAAKLGQAAIIKALYKQKANIYASNAFEITLLYAAAQGGHLDAAMELLQCSATLDIKIKDGEGETLLSLASKMGY
ncbi:Putative ankyrin repeat-containing domain superfamily [Colletotrichum destructivum]|uniref:Ankyrin repeat-containing domain superfamily n=1 Tax=Colletotrichum destructivum TaxID=34406 RepID=A0AAX4J4J8_9PEZI|nr:Putative ankyrin repeat-containing domain superfamily [Colletotrichum destructivum]